MDSNSLSVLLGGVGLFLLGMVLMTDGLKTAAGPTLSRILASSTQTRLRGLLSGIGITAVVQSSSAVTVATIGFVNAGLLTFGQSLWVIFGANVGTTMTGWLVALIGFKIKVEAAALPLIGLGMALRVSGAETRRGAAGTALAGFGVLFLGIGFLQQAFSGEAFDLSGFSGEGIRSVILLMLVGLLMTVIMQSSSAALAIVLTLAEAGALPLQDAAAAVIGANIGTTVTALIAAIGATPNARRAAAAHVLFNTLTGITALALLPLLIGVVDLLSVSFSLTASPAVSLALFHTIFNILGVILMWPLSNHLVAFLLRRFRSREEDVARLRYLDHNVASVPSLAADALRRELKRFGGIAISAVWSRNGLLTGVGNRPDDSMALQPLERAIAEFVTQVSRASMADNTAQKLAQLLRVQRYYETCGELAPEIATGHAAVVALGESPLHATVIAMSAYADSLLVQLNPETESFAPLDEAQAKDFELDYQQLKSEILSAGARGEIDIDIMESLTRSFSALRRIIDQGAKAARLLSGETTES